MKQNEILKQIGSILTLLTKGPVEIKSKKKSLKIRKLRNQMVFKILKEKAKKNVSPSNSKICLSSLIIEIQSFLAKEKDIEINEKISENF